MHMNSFFRPKFEMDETFSVIMKKEFIAIMNSHEKSGKKDFRFRNEIILAIIVIRIFLIHVNPNRCLCVGGTVEKVVASFSIIQKSVSFSFLLSNLKLRK